MVVLGGVEEEFAEDFTGGFVDHGDVAVVDEHQDVGSGVGSADADVVQAAVVADGDGAGGVDAVGADSGVGVGGAGFDVAGAGFGQGGVGGGRGAAVQGAVRAAGVVDLAEGVQLGLEVGDGPGWVLGGEPAFEGLVPAFDLPAGLRVAR